MQQCPHCGHAGGARNGWDGLPAAAGAGLGHCTQLFLCGVKFWEVLNAVCFIQSFDRTERRCCLGRHEVKYQCRTILRQASNFNFKSTGFRKQERVLYNEFWQCPGDLYNFSFYDFISHLGRFHYVCSSGDLLCLYFPS